MGNPMDELSPQEMRVLRLIARAKSDQEILCELNISARTLRHHVRNVMDKIHVNTRGKLMLWALENGFGEKRLQELRGMYRTSAK